jgi:hypothetical protein
MKNKKLIIIPATLACLYLILFALRSTFAGYAIVVWFGMECFNRSTCELKKLEKEGDVPDLFHMVVAQEPKNKELIPCLLYWESTRPNRILAMLEVSGGETDVQHLDLTRLELVLEDGRRESLLKRPSPRRHYFGDHKHANRFFSPSAGRLEHGIAGNKGDIRAQFYSSSWPATKQATLIAEGTLRRETGEDQPFRQVSVWQLSRHWGIRKIYAE